MFLHGRYPALQHCKTAVQHRGSSADTTVIVISEKLPSLHLHMIAWA